MYQLHILKKLPRLEGGTSPPPPSPYLAPLLLPGLNFRPSTGSADCECMVSHGERVVSHGECVVSHGECVVSHGECVVSHGECVVSHGVCGVTW